MSQACLTTPQSHASQTSRVIGTLHGNDQWWRDQYYDLERHGYALRPCYHPGQKPSRRRLGKKVVTVEDGEPSILRTTTAVDATRLHDSKHVMLKTLVPEERPYEQRIAQLFSSPELSGKRRNHCVPLLGIIEISDGQKFMVMPTLRPFNNPRLQTFGDFVGFFTQVCEGLQFMHERNVAHGDCTANNIMFDPLEMYPQGHSPRYYLIDFGLSRHYTSRNVLDEPLRGGDRSVPEHRDGTQCNPFHTDIYYLGNLVRQEFMRNSDGFEFMRDLVDKMTNVNPTERPLIEDVVTTFSDICETLDESKLRSPILSGHKPYLFIVFLCAKQALLTLWVIFACRQPS